MIVYINVFSFRVRGMIEKESIRVGKKTNRGHVFLMTILAEKGKILREGGTLKEGGEMLRGERFQGVGSC